MAAVADVVAVAEAVAKGKHEESHTLAVLVGVHTVANEKQKARS